MGRHLSPIISIEMPESSVDFALKYVAMEFNPQLCQQPNGMEKTIIRPNGTNKWSLHVAHELLCQHHYRLENGIQILTKLSSYYSFSAAAAPVVFSPSRFPAVFEEVVCSGSEQNVMQCSLTLVSSNSTGACSRHAGIQCNRK